MALRPPPLPPFPWPRVVLFGLWCAIAGALAGQFLPLNAVPRGTGLVVLVLLVALAMLRAVWAMRAAVGAWMIQAARRTAEEAADQRG